VDYPCFLLCRWAEAGVKKLVLVHVGPHLATHGAMDKGIGDVRRIYDGEVIFAEELMSPEVR